MPFLIRFALVVAFGGALSGCFISKEPLIGADKAVFPYAEITYAEADNGKPATLIRKGDPPTASRPRRATKRRCYASPRPATESYVVQMEFVEDNAVRRLFALLKVDLKKTVASYASVAPYDGELRRRPFQLRRGYGVHRVARRLYRLRSAQRSRRGASRTRPTASSK